MIWAGFLFAMVSVCLASLSFGSGTRLIRAASGEVRVVRFDDQVASARHLPPWWWSHTPAQRDRLALAHAERVSTGRASGDPSAPTRYWLGTDSLGRGLALRLAAGGGVSLLVGLASSLIGVLIGTAYGCMSGFASGRVDAWLMRAVDVMLALPYVLVVVLIAVAVDARLESIESRGTVISTSTRQVISIATLALAIGCVNWLTLARVVRSQVLSLRTRAFTEAARAAGLSARRQVLGHYLPNLIATVCVYATVNVPQAILQESFLSFLGIGIRPPVPSWGNLAAEGIGELNPYESNWWLLVFPCLAVSATLVALNSLGERLRAAFDPTGRV